MWTIPAPAITAAEATLELTRRYVHVFGPATQQGFAKWASLGAAYAARAFAELDDELIAVRTPTGSAHLLASDESLMREATADAAPARLLPSGDAYTLGITSEDRALLVPNDAQRDELWTPRVWPGAVLVGGKIVGTWRRAQRRMTIHVWGSLSRAAREAIVEEAESLPLPDAGERMLIDWS